MSFFKNLFNKLFGRKKNEWDEFTYTDKPSTEGDDFRKRNEV